MSNRGAQQRVGDGFVPGAPLPKGAGGDGASRGRAWLLGLSLGASITAQRTEAAIALESNLGPPLSSIVLDLAVPANPVDRIRFDFGFTTDETIQPARFADSFTISLENPLGQRAYLVTADASGPTWAPFVPGAIPLSSSLIERSLRPLDLSISPLATAFAYDVEVPLPNGWSEEPLRLRLDLFDNEDGVRSVGYVGEVTLVPEPTTTLLLSLGLLGLLWSRKRG